MKSNKIPMRQCVGCREMKPKRDLLRILRTPQGGLMMDPTGKKNGRGAYLCRDIQCLKKARKNKALERSFQMSIEQGVYEELEREWEGFEEE